MTAEKRDADGAVDGHTGEGPGPRESRGELGQTIGAFDAKTHLSRLLEEVRLGKTITITRRGVPVAVLAPPEAVRAAAGVWCPSGAPGPGHAAPGRAVSRH